MDRPAHTGGGWRLAPFPQHTVPYG